WGPASAPSAARVPQLPQNTSSSASGRPQPLQFCIVTGFSRSVPSDPSLTGSRASSAGRVRRVVAGGRLLYDVAIRCRLKKERYAPAGTRLAAIDAIGGILVAGKGHRRHGVPAGIAGDPPEPLAEINGGTVSGVEFLARHGSPQLRAEQVPVSQEVVPVDRGEVLPEERDDGLRLRIGGSIGAERDGVARSSCGRRGRGRRRRRRR